MTTVTQTDISIRRPTGPLAVRADIQGLRAVAVLLVVTFHAGLPVPAGFAGVDVFFVISGYVITGQIYRQYERNSFSFQQFYARRIRRLMPALAVLLCATLLTSLLLQSPLGPQSATARVAFGAALAAGNVEILRTTGDYFDAAAESNPLLHVWSLGVEEQFYLLFPMILLTCYRFRRRAMFALSLLTFISFVASLWLSFSDRIVAGHYADQLAFYSSPTRAWEFGVGALLALWTGQRNIDVRRPPPVLLAGFLAAVGIFILVTMNIVVDGKTAWPGFAAAFPVAGAALIIAAGTLAPNAINGALKNRLLVWIGDRSYSIYLWHWPFIVFARLVWPEPSWIPMVAAVASLAPAAASFRFIETPFRVGHFVQRHVYVVAAASTGLIVVMTLAMPRAEIALFPEASKLQKERTTQTFGRATGCMLLHTLYKASDIDRCTVKAPKRRGWIMLAGDSHADALSTGVIGAGTGLGYDTLALTGAGCPITFNAISDLVPNCSELSKALLAKATGRDRPDLVILAHWDLPRLDDDSGWFVKDLRPTVDALHRAHVPVLFALDVPNFSAPDAAEASPCRGWLLDFSCTRKIGGIDDYQGASRAAEMAFADEMGMQTFDPWPTFCNDSKCDSRVDGKLAYWDAAHLNGAGSAALQSSLAIAIRGAARHPHGQS